jgi:hypothetical protein
LLSLFNVSLCCCCGVTKVIPSHNLYRSSGIHVLLESDRNAGAASEYSLVSSVSLFSSEILHIRCVSKEKFRISDMRHDHMPGSKHTETLVNAVRLLVLCKSRIACYYSRLHTGIRSLKSERQLEIVRMFRRIERDMAWLTEIIVHSLWVRLKWRHNG